MISLQDVPVKNSFLKARVMFDNGLELPLILSFFAKKNNLSYSYTISGVGGGTTTFHSADSGRIYDVPLVETSRGKIMIKTYAVESILSENIGIKVLTQGRILIKSSFIQLLKRKEI